MTCPALKGPAFMVYMDMLPLGPSALMSVHLNRVVSSQHGGNAVKRWLSTFAENPSPAALTVAVEDLDERKPCSHELSQQRDRVLQNGGCSKRTGADCDRTQRASISSARAGHSDSVDCLVLLCSAAATATSCRCCKTKASSARDWKEVFTRGLKCKVRAGRAHLAFEVPRVGVAECAFGPSLHPPHEKVRPP